VDFRELYQEMILGHSQEPRNFRALEDASHVADGNNPLCGDKCRVFVQVEDGKVADICFQGEGCAISTASASLMTESLKGLPLDEAQALFKQFHQMITTDVEPDLDALGKLAVFSGVRVFPLRVKCATLAWHTFDAALQRQNTASTE